MPLQGTDNRSDAVEGGEDALCVLLEQTRFGGAQPVVVTEATDRLAERHMDVDVVDRVATSVGGIRSLLPDVDDILFGPALFGAVEVAEAGAVVQSREFFVPYVLGRTVFNPVLVHGSTDDVVHRAILDAGGPLRKD